MGNILEFIPRKPLMGEAAIPKKNIFEVIARVISVGESDDSRAHLLDIESLGDVYSELEATDREMLAVLDKYEADGIITKTEKIILASLFLTSQQISPDLLETKNIIFGGKIDLATLERELEQTSVAPPIKKFILRIAVKLPKVTEI